MIALPENRILKTLVIASTVAVVICYGWLVAHLMEPTFTTPSYVSETLLRTSESHLLLFEEKFRDLPTETSHLNVELSQLEPVIKWIGGLKRPVEILVDERVPERLLVTDSRIEIGRDVLLAHGQLSKAVLKTWLLQNASATVVSSHLRLEVASDVLLAMLTGHFNLEVPGHEAITFETTDKAWWTYANSYHGVCNSAWKSLELASLCDNKAVSADLVNVSALSFRGFIGSRIWKSYGATPLKHRLQFVQNWIGELKRSRTVVVPSLKSGWLAVVQGELETLLPREMDPLAGERSSWLPKIDAPLIVIDGDGKFAAPGTLLISSAEFEFKHARMAVMTACEPPILKTIVSLPFAVERVVWRPECQERKTDFVQVRPSAIRLALERGLAKETDRIDQFVLQNRDVASSAGARFLGVADAKWDAQESAYQVRGAIQAVDSFRLGKSKN